MQSNWHGYFTVKLAKINIHSLLGVVFREKSFQLFCKMNVLLIHLLWQTVKIVVNMFCEHPRHIKLAYKKLKAKAKKTQNVDFNLFIRNKLSGAIRMCVILEHVHVC